MMVSMGIMFVLSSMSFCPLVRKVQEGHTHTHRLVGTISLFFA
jgi:hypothetical protein